MDPTSPKADKLNFLFLPDYASFLVEQRLEAFSHQMTLLSHEESLPLLNALRNFSQEQLAELSMSSNRRFLTSLAENKAREDVEQNVKKWAANKLFVDQHEVVAEDLSQLAYIKRKAFAYFLKDYTQDPELNRHLQNEIDVYTTQEELLFYTSYFKIQQDRFNETRERLVFQETLLLEAQEIAEFGSYMIDYENPDRSMQTPQLARMTGLPEFSHPALFFDYVHPDDVELIRQPWENAVNSGGQFDYKFRYSKDGQVRRFRSTGIITLKGGKMSMLRGTLKDVTKEYQLIEKLMESEELHKQAQKLTHIGNWSWDVVTNKVHWSDEMYRIYGLDPQSEEITFDRFLELIHPDNRAARVKEIEESLRTLQVKDYTLKILNPDGVIKILKGRGEMITDEENRPVKLLGTCQDITKEYQFEQELRELNNSLSVKNNELERINKELESFNYIASHDLQEPLRKIRIFAGRFSEQSGILPEAAQNSIEKVVSSAARMQNLIRDLIDFSHLTSSSKTFEVIQLSEVVNEICINLKDSVENENVVFKIAPLPTIKGIPFQFSQLFTNLLENAVKYRNEGVFPEVVVESQLVLLSENGELLTGTSSNYLEISVKDNGIGFDSDQKEKIFDLFRRLHAKDKYAGTGIGLAICKKIVSNHSGFIKAESFPGNGSRFAVYLPIAMVIS